MDRVEVWALVGGSVTKFQLEAQEVSLVQMDHGGLTVVKVKGCTYQDKQITGANFAEAAVVLVYMGRHDQ